MSSYRTSTRRYSVYNSNSRGRNQRSASKGRRGQYIDPTRFVRKAQMSEIADYQAVHKFTDFDVNPILHTNIQAMGYDTPSPIQDQTIPPALEGKDIIGVANTGTGKTAAFAIPVLNKLLADKSARALIIAPTRELAQQIEEGCRLIAKGSGISGAVLIGGTAMGPQLRDLRDNPQIVIGTPGRIKDHIERRSLNLNGFNLVVLDEVDRMLDMGFVMDVTTILKQLASNRQSFFFSATMDTKVSNLIKSFSNDPVTISIKTGDTADNVHQNVVRFGSTDDKMDKLHSHLLETEVEKIIVFDETQRSVERLSNELETRGFKADAIHGGKSQGQRQRALNRFKKNEVNILVATDVAARGIDVSDITHVINYTVPQSYDDYVHRIGRAGRAGRVGYALTFVQH
jgi:ATP-dependent RNA helicase RhlE